MCFLCVPRSRGHHPCSSTWGTPKANASHRRLPGSGLLVQSDQPCKGSGTQDGDGHPAWSSQLGCWILLPLSVPPASSHYFARPWGTILNYVPALMSMCTCTGGFCTHQHDLSPLFQHVCPLPLCISTFIWSISACLLELPCSSCSWY